MPVHQTSSPTLLFANPAPHLLSQLKQLGFNCLVADNLKQLFTLSHSLPSPQIVILDPASCPTHSLVPLKTLAQKNPLIFISSKQDTATRLFAAQAGGSAFLTQPLTLVRLMVQIEALSQRSDPLYRVLVLYNNSKSQMLIENTLKKSGMIVNSFNNPLELNEQLTQTQPELILLEHALSFCPSSTLAKVIRQHDLFAEIPIVYFSTQPKAHIHPLQEEGDDFLLLPAARSLLTKTVIARIKRWRKLCNHLTQDSLTGLLNHGRILDLLAQEVARAYRHQTPLSFAMIDIDHFKAINDFFGHPTGDKVIQKLAQLLKQTLRKTDSIGRYGGEEFAIIFPQTAASVIYPKLEAIRLKAPHCHLGGKVTLSIGLAELGKDTPTFDKLIKAADCALYQAKNKGRNQTIFWQNKRIPLSQP